MNFPHLLKQKRLKLGLTQKQTAIALNTIEKNYQKWELGIRIPNAIYIIKILILFNISLEEALEALEN